MFPKVNIDFIWGVSSYLPIFRLDRDKITWVAVTVHRVPWLKKEEASRSSCSWSISSDPWLREREEGNLPAFLFQIDDQWRLAQREGKSAKIPALDRFPMTPGLERKGKLPLVIFAVRWFQPDVSMWSFGLDCGIIENPAVSLGVILTHCDSVEWTGVSPTCPMSFLTKQFHAAECLESEQILSLLIWIVPRTWPLHSAAIFQWPWQIMQYYFSHFYQIVFKIGNNLEQWILSIYFSEASYSTWGLRRLLVSIRLS